MKSQIYLAILTASLLTVASANARPAHMDQNSQVENGSTDKIATEKPADAGPAHMDQDSQLKNGSTDKIAVRETKATEHCPDSEKLKEAIKQHEDDMMARKSFDVDIDKDRWKTTNIRMNAPEGKSLGDMINLPLTYKVRGSPKSRRPQCSAHFSADGSEWLTFVLTMQ